MLDTLPGGGGYKENELINYSNNLDLLIDSLRVKKIQRYDNYDKMAFNSSDRKELIKKTGNVLIDERNKQIQKVNDLQKAIINKNNGKETKVKKELEGFKIINEVVQIKKPKTHQEYIDIISKDISKLVKGNSSDYDKEVSSIPINYKLSQNYPNPFNPVTKINYELPKDGKVKLVIYDILGREIKTLVNELKQAGRYMVEFNGNNYASGIYFYRIQVEGGKGYTSVKKMVLVK
jgi:hypothetical protein